MGNQNHAYATVKSLKQRKTFGKLLEFDVFSLAPTLSPYSYICNWNLPKIRNEFKCLMHTDILKLREFAKFPILASKR